MSIFELFKKKKQTSKTSVEDITATVLPFEMNEIVINTDENLESIPADASKIGGKPWLPLGFEWPLFIDDDEPARPLSFLCQINLSDVKQSDRDGLLPDHGMLYFFYDCEAFRWGFDPEDDGCARVFYFENTDNFVSMDIPNDIFEEYKVPEIAVSFTTKKSYPQYEELEIHSDIDCQWEDYDKALTNMGCNMGTECHKILGYADIIQNEILSECERVSRGLYCGDAESYQNTPEDEEASILKSAKDWILLLQLSTLEKDGFELMWGDCGMLYFYIRKQDLADKRFEKAWFALQCG